MDNRDGTRSLLNRSNKKLLVTFRAENQDYDKEVFKPSDKISSAKTSKGLPQLGNIKKQLVTSKSDNTSDPNFTKCVDVYLCDSCDKDFDNLSALVVRDYFDFSLRVLVLDRFPWNFRIGRFMKNILVQEFNLQPFYDMRRQGIQYQSIQPY